MPLIRRRVVAEARPIVATENTLVSELVAGYSTICREVVEEQSAGDKLLVDENTMTCMPSAENWPGACSASKEARGDVNDKSPIIDDGEKVEQKVRNVSDVYKVGRSLSDSPRCVQSRPKSVR